MKLLGPISQLLPMHDLPAAGAIADEQLTILSEQGIAVANGKIEAVMPYAEALPKAQAEGWEIERLEGDWVVLPGLIDCHTHLCWHGNRAREYAMRVGGKSYQEILAAGGGIHDSVAMTRAATTDDLRQSTLARAQRQLAEGITTCEVKSGYGLSVAAELKMLEAIQFADQQCPIDLVPTCLAAHVPPKEAASAQAYLDEVIDHLLPEVMARKLAARVDIFVEDNAFSAEIAKPYLLAAKGLGFGITVHADQFITGGSQVALEVGALSADHLEASGEAEIAALAEAGIVQTVLPGASLGLGMAFAPARRILDAGGTLAISTDWNPGSAPMGNLFVQAAILGAYQKLTIAETLAGITVRAAQALGLGDRGSIAPGQLADLVAYPVSDYRDLWYRQGMIAPGWVWKRGEAVSGHAPVI